MFKKLSAADVFELFTTKPPQTPLQIMWCYELLSEEEYYKLCESLFIF